MRDTVQARSLLVVGIHNVPRRLLKVCMGKHLILGSRVIHPTPARLNIHRAEFPTLDRVAHAFLESSLLLLVIHGEPILDQNDSGTNQHFLEHGTGSKKLTIFFLSAESHHSLDASAVVPASVKEDHLTTCGQFGYPP